MNLKKYVFTVLVVFTVNPLIAMQNNSSNSDINKKPETGIANIMPYFITEEIFKYLSIKDLEKFASVGNKKYNRHMANYIVKHRDFFNKNRVYKFCYKGKLNDSEHLKDDLKILNTYPFLINIPMFLSHL